MKRIIYLAGPYTHPDPFVRENRFRALTEVAAAFVVEGHIVFSPITMSHPIDVLLPEIRDTDFWCDFDEPFMTVCNELVIVALDGWQDSAGVRRERAWFEARNLPVSVVAQWDGHRMAETVELGSVHGQPGPAQAGCAR